MKYFSTFSGIGGFELGIQLAYETIQAKNNHDTIESCNVINVDKKESSIKEEKSVRTASESINLNGDTTILKKVERQAGSTTPCGDRECSKCMAGYANAVVSKKKNSSRSNTLIKMDTETESDMEQDICINSPLKNKTLINTKYSATTAIMQGEDMENVPICVGFSEIDKYATEIYQKHFPEHRNFGDITKIVAEELPDFDLLVGGFPCQAFSIAGKRGGFEDTRGTMFFELARILRAKQPRLCVFENVKGLLSHDGGKSFATIIQTLDELGYDCQWQVPNSKNHGVPQNRERVFIVGNRRGTERPNVFPIDMVQCENDKTTINEKVYQMSDGISSYSRELLLGMAQQEEQKLSRQQMQDLFTKIEQGIQAEECAEIEREPQEIRQQSERDIQEVETLGAFLASANHTKDFRGMVQIPTEDMLLLWTQGGGATQRIGQLQQQDKSADDRQTRLNEALRKWELSSLLFAVQPYQGQLFYSIGDGTDWVNVYQTKVEKICKTNDLSSILEEHPDPKYFLSETIAKRLIIYRDNIQTPLPPVIMEDKQTERTSLKVNSMHKLNNSTSRPTPTTEYMEQRV